MEILFHPALGSHLGVEPTTAGTQQICLTTLIMQHQRHAFVVLVPKPRSQHFYTSCIEIGEPTDILSYTYNSSPE